MKKWNLVVDIDKCCNCGNCEMAVKDEYVGNDFPGYAESQPLHDHKWLSVDRHTRGQGSIVDVSYVVRTCNHCDDAPCVAAGKGAVKKRPDGIVIIEPQLAKGRRDLIDACPYRAIVWNEERQIPQHWIFDAHLLDAGWTEPRCVQACPTGALRSYLLSDQEMSAKVRDERLDVSQPELGTRPRVYYKGLNIIREVFIGGNVATCHNNGVMENVVGAKVEVRINGSQKLESQTDAYGDFKIDGIAANGSSFEVRVTHPAFEPVVRTGVLHESLNVGTLVLGT